MIVWIVKENLPNWDMVDEESETMEYVRGAQRLYLNKTGLTESEYVAFRKTADEYWAWQDKIDEHMNRK